MDEDEAADTLTEEKEEGSSVVTFAKAKTWRQQAESHWNAPHDESRRLEAFSYAAPGTQWDQETLELRTKGKLPVKQFGFVNGMVLQVINPIRESPPRGAIKPVGMGYQAKQDAQVLTGVLRADENICDAESTYLSALESSVRGGFGAWRYLVDKDDGRWQIRVLPLLGEDVFYDPTSQRADYSDARWCLIRCILSEFDYKTRWPLGTAEAIDEKVTVWELYVREQEHILEPEIEGGTVSMRPKIRTKIVYYCFDDNAFLEEDDEYRGPDIPVVLESAPSIMVDGVRMVFPLTHHVEQQQKEHNFWRNDAIFDAATQPRARFISKRGSLVNPQDWANSSATAAKTILEWEGDEKPEIRETAQATSGYLELAGAALDSARVAVNIYPDPSLQGKMDAPSGESVKQQRAGSGVANYQHTDCHYKAIKRGTRIHINLIAAYYGDDQVREAMGNDGSTTQVSIGPTKIDGVANIDLQSVKYMVDVDVGPSYSTQREQNQDQWMDFAGKIKDPAALQLITYWLLKQSPLQGSDDVADWFLATMPPQIQQAIQMKDQVAGSEMDPQKLIQKVTQLSQQNSELQKHLAATVQALQHETQQVQSKQADIESRERTAANAQAAETERAHMGILAGHIKTDAETERDLLLSQMESRHAQSIEELKGHFATTLEQIRGEFALEKQARENESDERLAHQKGANLSVIA